MGIVLRNRGRPIGSKVRQNIIEILYFFKKLYGYELFKIYSDLYPKISMRLVYYHLKKGVDTGEFQVNKIEKKSGKFSWGDDSENILYELGANAKPVVEPRIQLYFEEYKIKEKNRNIIK